MHTYIHTHIHARTPTHMYTFAPNCVLTFRRFITQIFGGVVFGEEVEVQLSLARQTLSTMLLRNHMLAKERQALAAAKHPATRDQVSCCICVASVLHPCCICVASVLHPCCICVAPMLHPCCTHVASVLHPCCIHVAPMLHLCCTHVASVLHPCCTHVASMWCACVCAVYFRREH
jgi:hypothetical protein